MNTETSRRNYPKKELTIMKTFRMLSRVVATAALLSSLFRNSPVLAQGCPTPSFTAVRVFNAGGNLQSVAVGDFNGDGKPDLAVASPGLYDPTTGTVTNTGVSVLLGKGDGTFQPAVNFAVRGTPKSVAVGDFNNDGKPDLAVANQGSYDPTGTLTNTGVLVLLGKGDGTFQAAVNYAPGKASVSVAVGDFNGDGKPDLAVANKGDGTVSILLGKGDGTFQPAVDYAVRGTPGSVAVGDFNGDGKPDLVVANPGLFDAGGPPTTGSVSVLLGKGDGTFQPAANSDAVSPQGSVAVGDFNSDGKLDLAVANQGSYDPTGTLTNAGVSVLLGKGDGTFQAAVNYGAGAAPVSVVAGDFNGDGKLDLAVANNRDGTVSILLGKGDGTFPSGVNYGAGAQSLSIAVGDFNNDGKPDLAVTKGTETGAVAVILNKGDGTFQTAANYDAGAAPISVAVGDFNGDGKLDLAVANDESFGTVSVLLGKGDGTFQSGVNYDVGAQPSSIAVGDFNNDGKPDLAVANGVSGTVSVLLGKGDGTFQAAGNYDAGLGPVSVAVGDFNGDGKPDLAVANSAGVSIIMGQGDGTFAPFIHYAVGPDPQSVAVADFNGDSKLDLVVANFGSFEQGTRTNGSVSVLLGKGDGTFHAAINYGAGTTPDSVAVGDFNGDGKPDLAVANWITDTVSVLLGRGDGTFQPAVTYGAGPFPESVAVGDFNGDGKPDLAVANGNSDTVSVLLGKGDGLFQEALNYEVGEAPIFVAVGDFNRDSKADLVVAKFSVDDHAVSVLLNTCAPAGVDLGIQRSQASVTISWPFVSSALALESTTSLSAPNWRPAVEAMKTNGPRLEVTVPAGLGERYFRLRTQ
jgi:FG-GAP-like repeat/FG-GAP repeat